MRARNRRNQKGNSLLEFALASTVLIPLFFGTVGIGLNMGRSTQTLLLCRDIAHMYANTVDFSQAASKNVAVQLASGTGMTVNGGNAVIILSQVITVYQADCDAGGYPNGCANLGKQVIVNRIAIGNTALTSSRYGTPNSNIVTANGNIAQNDYLINASAVATNFSSVLADGGLTQNQGDIAYLGECYVLTPDTSYLGTNTSQGVYAKFVF